MCEVVSKKHCFKKPIVFQKNIVFEHVHFLSHCFETKTITVLNIKTNTLASKPKYKDLFFKKSVTKNTMLK